MTLKGNEGIFNGIERLQIQNGGKEMFSPGLQLGTGGATAGHSSYKPTRIQEGR